MVGQDYVEPIKANMEGKEKMVADYDDEGFGFMPRDYASTDPWGRCIVRLDFLQRFLRENKMKILLYSQQQYGNRQDIVCGQLRKGS